MSKLRHLGWDQCSRGLTPRPLESCHHQCLQAVCGVLGYPKGAPADLLYGTLQLRYCTAVFFLSGSPWWSLPGHGGEVGKRDIVTTAHLSDDGSNPDNTGPVPGFLCMTGRIEGFQRQSDGKGWFPRGRGGRASPPFSSPWGWLSSAHDAWNLPSERTGVGGFRLVSPAEAASALGLVHFN